MKRSARGSICQTSHARKISQPPKKGNDKRKREEDFNNVAINFITQSCHHHHQSSLFPCLCHDCWKTGDQGKRRPWIHLCLGKRWDIIVFLITTIWNTSEFLQFVNKYFIVNEFSFPLIRQWGPSHWQLQLRRVNTFFKNAQTNCEVDLEFVCDWLIKNIYERYCEVDFTHGLPISQVHKFYLHTFHIFSNSRGL